MRERWGVRQDAPGLGTSVLWGLSIAQVVAGFLLLTAALREVVPGRAAGRAVPRAGLALAFGLVLGVTFLTWHVSATIVPNRLWGAYWRVCFTRPTEIGGLVLLLALFFAVHLDVASTDFATGVQ